MHQTKIEVDFKAQETNGTYMTGNWERTRTGTYFSKIAFLRKNQCPLVFPIL